MKTILIIEDNADIRENVAEILMLSNYKVITAANGKEGIEMAQKQHPDLIPYKDLRESEKEYDRKAAMETIKTIIALGYRIVRE